MYSEFWGGSRQSLWSPPQGLGVGFSQNKAFSQDTCWGLGSSAGGPVPQILPLFESVDGLVTSQGGRMAETGVGGTFWASQVVPQLPCHLGIHVEKVQGGSGSPRLPSPTQVTASRWGRARRALRARGRFWNQRWSGKHTGFAWEAWGWRGRSFLLNETQRGQRGLGVLPWGS